MSHLIGLFVPEIIYIKQAVADACSNWDLTCLTSIILIDSPETCHQLSYNLSAIFNMEANMFFFQKLPDYFANC